MKDMNPSTFIVRCLADILYPFGFSITSVFDIISFTSRHNFAQRFFMKIGFALPQKQENHKTSLRFHYFQCYHYQGPIQKFLKGCELLTCAQFFLRTPLYQIHSNVFERFAYNFIFYSKDAPLILFSFYSYKLNNRRSLFTYILQTILTIFSNIQPYAFKWSL